MMEWFVTFLCLIIIAMLAAYFIRENELRKEQNTINKDLAKAIKDLAEVVNKMKLQ
jgi:hypothetical protein